MPTDRRSRPSPTTSNGWWSSTISVRPLYCLTMIGKSPFSSNVVSSVGRRKSRSLYGAPSTICPYSVRYRGRTHVAPALHDQQLGRSGEAPAVHDAARQHHVVARLDREIPELRFERSRALRHVHDLVSLGVAKEVLVVHVRLGPEHGDVGVEQQRDAVEWASRPSAEGARAEVTVSQGEVVVLLVRRLLAAPHALDRRGRMDMIEQRRRAGEALVAHQLLAVQAAVGAAEDRACAAPARGCGRTALEVPRSACSRSMLSNSAGSFPCRTPWRPCAG